MRNIINTTGALFFMVLLVSGCASIGNESIRKESESSVAQKITEGKTSKDEIRSMFGSPISISFTDSGLAIWKYELSNMSADAVSYIPVVNLFGTSSSGTKKELTVLFDEKGIVKRYAMNESPVQIKTGATVPKE
jgi:outer membrane protein assembly factor BamE (lipoprotein component of BamABCDE complex)